MDELMQKSVSNFMTKDVFAISKDETIKKLFKLMDEGGILGVPVVDENEIVVGIVTESDLLKHFTTLKSPQAVQLLGSLIYLEDTGDFNQHLKQHCAETVKDLMTEDVTTIHQDASLSAAIDTMAGNKVNRIPVTDGDGKLVGIITRTDIVHQLAKLKTP